MNIDIEVVAKLIAPLLSAALAAVSRVFEAKAKLISFYGHVSVFELDDPNDNTKKLPVNAHSVVVRNAGRKPAHNVRLMHQILPAYKVFPLTDYKVDPTPGGVQLLFPVLVPGEQVTVSYMYFPPLIYNQINTTIKSDEGFAKVVDVIPTPQLNKAVRWLAVGLAFIGASVVFYYVILFIVRGALV